MSGAKRTTTGLVTTPRPASQAHVGLRLRIRVSFIEVVRSREFLNAVARSARGQLNKRAENHFPLLIGQLDLSQFERNNCFRFAHVVEKDRANCKLLIIQRVNFRYLMSRNNP